MLEYGPQQAHVFRSQADGTALPYLLYLPEGYTPNATKKWPLVLFLHGRGESGNGGDELVRVTYHGLAKLITQGQTFPFIAASPQCPFDSAWPKKVEALNGLLDELEQTCVIDHDRVYLTGLSMGGYGSWALGSAHPERFAAIVPICGGGDPRKVCALKDVPIWNFHGAKDDVVPLVRSVELVDALKACGGNVRFTVYPKAGHDSWTETYANPELYTWLLAQRKGAISSGEEV